MRADARISRYASGRKYSGTVAWELVSHTSYGVTENS